VPGVTFDAQEQSVYGGAPGEYYLLAMGAATWYLTSGDIAVTIDGHTYTPAQISREQIEYSGEEWSGNLEITLPATHAIAVLLDGPAPLIPLTLTLFRKHRTDAAIQRFGPSECVGATFKGALAKLTFAPISRVLKRLVPSIVFQNQCPLALYGTRCGIDRDAVSGGTPLYNVTATITAVDGKTLSAAAFATKGDGWFLNGYVELASLERRFVVGHVGTLITLMYPFPAAAVVVDDEVLAYAGCDRTEPTCISKFNNLDHHLGYCRIPYRNPFAKGTA
jgi:uncharacterized phage protein (TIGR02218 family)